MLSLLDRAQARFPERDGFKVTNSLIDEVASQLNSARSNPVRFASRLGVPVRLIRYILNELPSPETRATVLSEDGWGRKELRDFIITRKAAGTGWADADKDIIQAGRDKYDDGKVEMCQGRDGDFIILYAIPRKKPVTRHYRYFSEELDLSDE